MRFQELARCLHVVYILMTVGKENLHTGQGLRDAMAFCKSDQTLFPFVAL